MHRHDVIDTADKTISQRVYSIYTLLLLLFTFFFLGGCQNVDKVSESLIFRYNEDATVSSLDPAYVKSQAEIWIASQIFNGLIELDSHFNPIPSLAKSWEISENGTVYKFNLKRNIFFIQKDGAHEKKVKRFDAYDVLYSFLRMIKPSTASPGAWIFNEKVKMPSDLQELNNLNSQKNPFYAPNDSTVIIKLKTAFAPFLKLLGTSYCYIVPNGMAEQPSFGHSPIGTGPFYAKMWEDDIRLVLRKNNHYFEYEGENQLPYLEAVNVDFIKNKQTAFLQFLSGNYDFFNGLETSYKDELLSFKGELKEKYASRINMLKKPFLNTEYIGFYLGKDGVLQNENFRMALSYAVDRKAIVKYIRNGIGEVGIHGFVPPDLLTEKVKGFSYDLKKAIELMEKSGVDEKTELSLTTTSDYMDIAVLLKNNWSKLGLQVKIDIQNGAMLRQKRNKGDVQLFRGSWIADYSDAENYLACFTSPNFSPSGPNYTHFGNSSFDNAYNDLLNQTTPEMIAKKSVVADQLLISKAPIIVLYYDKSLRLSQKTVQNLGNDASNRLILKNVRKQK